VLIAAKRALPKTRTEWAFLGSEIMILRVAPLPPAPLLLPLPLAAGLTVLPLIGMALNGTSSVLYGTVPELVAPERRQRAFGIFYTGGVGAGALAPVLYGLASDLADVPTMMLLVAAVVLVTLPLAWRLGPYLRQTTKIQRW